MIDDFVEQHRFLGPAVAQIIADHVAGLASRRVTPEATGVGATKPLQEIQAIRASLRAAGRVVFDQRSTASASARRDSRKRSWLRQFVLFALLFVAAGRLIDNYRSAMDGAPGTAPDRGASESPPSR